MRSTEHRFLLRLPILLAGIVSALVLGCGDNVPLDEVLRTPDANRLPTDDDCAQEPRPRVAMNGSGSGMMVWNDGKEVWARKYTAGIGWEPDRRVHVRDQFVWDLRVAMYGRHALAIWREAGIRLYGAEYSADAGWDSTTEFVAHNEHGIRKHAIATSTFGGTPSALVVWGHVLDGPGIQNAVHGNRYQFGGGWEGVHHLDDGEGRQGFVDVVAVSMDGSGSGQAIWRRGGDEYAAGWDTPRRLGGADAAGVKTDIALDVEGNGVAVWVEDGRVHSRRYTKATDSWGAPQSIGHDGYETLSADVALNGDGNGFAAWCLNERGVYAARFTAGVWSSPVRLDVDDTGAPIRDGTFDDDSPLVGVDAAGYARAVWQEGSDLYSSRFDVHTGWGPASAIGTARARTLDFAVDPLGRAIAVWWRTNQVHGSPRTKVWDPPLPSAVHPMVYSAVTGSNGDLWVVEFDGVALASAPERITSTPGDDQSPTMSPYGSRICFTRDYQIWIADSDGENPTQLTKAPGYRSEPTFTPDGGSIVYEDGGSLLVLDLSPGGATTTLVGTGWNGSPSVSPDGSLLAFASSRNLPTGAAAPSNIWIVPMDGSAAPTPVTTSSYAAAEISYSAPAWSPDGSKIACLRFDGVDAFDIYVLDAFGAGQTELATVGGRENYGPVFTPDGRSVVYTSRYSPQAGTWVREIWWVPADGTGSAELLGPVGDVASHPSFPGKP